MELDALRAGAPQAWRHLPSLTSLGRHLSRRVIAHQLMTTAELTITDAQENGCADW